MDKTFQHNQKMHNLIANVYDTKHCEIYNQVEQLRLNRTISEIMSYYPNPESVRVLDFGAGTGNVAIKFLNFGCLVKAADPSIKSLEILRRKVQSDKLATVVLTSQNIPLANDSFDIVCAYSVLHHIADYLGAIKEMLRVLKPGGLLCLDHEASENRYSPNHYLAEYNEANKQTAWEHIRKLYSTRELFSMMFFKTVWMKLFVNRRFEREGDIHVWSDDHIEWKKIFELAAKENCRIEKQNDYLLYQSKGGEELYLRYKDKCTDTRYVLIRKANF